jgi:hypothetical protein
MAKCDSCKSQNPVIPPVIGNWCQTGLPTGFNPIAETMAWKRVARFFSSRRTDCGHPKTSSNHSIPAKANFLPNVTPQQFFGVFFWIWRRFEKHVFIHQVPQPGRVWIAKKSQYIFANCNKLRRKGQEIAINNF